MNNMNMKRILMSMLSAVMALTATAQGYKDVTSDALLNPSFELSAEGTASHTAGAVDC